jgi:predicted class III extradiol MEMO1 family dioxygenase
MEWKSYYRNEFSLPKARSHLDRLFQTHAEDPGLDALLSRSAILSFPHTSLFYGGEATVRVVSALCRAGIERVIALGVFHLWGLAATRDTYAQAMDPQGHPEARSAAFDALRGAFLPAQRRLDTPYGSVALSASETPPILRPDESGLLAEEYSLDTFAALLARCGQIRGTALPELLPIYVAMTRNPRDGSFDTARELADAVLPLRTDRTAIVATGDVTHHGTGYTPDEFLQGRPTGARGLEPLLRKEVGDAIRLVVRDKAYERAFPIFDQRLNNDQRYLLPVVSEILGPGADSQILDFRLSDYATINHVVPPCFVASSLVAHGPAAGFTHDALCR